MSHGEISQLLRELARAIEDKEELRGPGGLKNRQLVTIERLLAGGSADPSFLNYSLRGWHIGIAVCGLDPMGPLHDLRPRFEARLLHARAETEMAWAWLGGHQRLAQHDLALLKSMKWPAGVAVACGEILEGIDGWRLSHRQAVAALPIAQSQSAEIVHYPDVALLATALHDDLLSSSLRQSYLHPIEADRDGGLVAKDTLRAYYKAERNASSAAADLGVNRATVRNRLAAIGERLGRDPDAISAELEVALRLDAVMQRDASHSDVAH